MISDERRDLALALIKRLLVSIIPITAGVFLLSRVQGWSDLFQIIVGTILVLSSAYIICPPLASFLGIGFGAIFFPDRYDDRPPPQYSIPLARKAQGKYEDAIAAYDDILLEYPQDFTAYKGMMEIMIIHLKDKERARETMLQAVSACSDIADKNRIRRCFDDLAREYITS